MNDTLAARHRDPAIDASDPAADTAVPDGRMEAQGPRGTGSPDEPETVPQETASQEAISQETILELLGERAGDLRGTHTGFGPDAVPALEGRLFGEILIDTADDVLETLQRERAENWAFRFADPARASTADILEQLRSRTESLERISAACHGLLWHLRRAQELGVVGREPSGALTHAGWFVELMEARAGTPRQSGAGTGTGTGAVRHPAWALTAVLERFRGPAEVRQYLDRICAQSHGAVERLLADQVSPLVQSLRAAQASYSLHRA
jgi:hypothetical protein